MKNIEIKDYKFSGIVIPTSYYIIDYIQVDPNSKMYFSGGLYSTLDKSNENKIKNVYFGNTIEVNIEENLFEQAYNWIENNKTKDEISKFFK